MAHLADELLHMIFKNLCSHCSGPHFPALPVSEPLRNVVLVSKRFHRIAEPLLYHAFSSQDTKGSYRYPVRGGEVEWGPNKPGPVIGFLQVIIRRPELAAEVRLLDLTARSDPGDFFDGEFDDPLDLRGRENNTAEQKLYILLLRLVYLQCPNLETLNFRSVYPFALEDDGRFTLESVASQLPVSIDDLLGHPQHHRRPLRSCNLYLELNSAALGVDHNQLQGLRSLTITRPSTTHEMYFPRYNLVDEMLSGLQELNLLGLSEMEYWEIEDKLHFCHNLRVFRLRLKPPIDEVNAWFALVYIIEGLHNSRATLEYLEFSPFFRTPSFLSKKVAILRKDLSEFTTLKTLKLVSGHVWDDHKQLALSLNEARPDSTWLGTKLALKSQQVYENVRWLPPNLTRLDIALITPCELEFIPCLAVGKAECYPNLVDLRVSFEPEDDGRRNDDGCRHCYGKWNESLETRCGLETAYEGQFDILERDSLFRDAGIRVQRLGALRFWHDIYSCEDAD